MATAAKIEENELVPLVAVQSSSLRSLSSTSSGSKGKDEKAPPAAAADDQRVINSKAVNKHENKEGDKARTLPWPTLRSYIELVNAGDIDSGNHLQMLTTPTESTALFVERAVQILLTNPTPRQQGELALATILKIDCKCTAPWLAKWTRPPGVVTDCCVLSPLLRDEVNRHHFASRKGSTSAAAPAPAAVAAANRFATYKALNFLVHDTPEPKRDTPLCVHGYVNAIMRLPPLIVDHEGPSMAAPDKAPAKKHGRAASAGSEEARKRNRQL